MIIGSTGLISKGPSIRRGASSKARRSYLAPTLMYRRIPVPADLMAADPELFTDIFWRAIHYKSILPQNGEC